MTTMAHDPRLHALRIVIPFDLVVPDNARLGVVKGRAILTRRYRASKRAIQLLALKARQELPDAVREYWPVSSPRVVSLQIVVFSPDARRRDIGNVVKQLGDGLAGVAYQDDAQIDYLSIVRAGMDREHPRVEISVWETYP